MANENQKLSAVSHKSYNSVPQTRKEICKIRVYKRRWYIALVFALFSLEQGSVANTWGPISNTAEEVYGWDDSTIALLSLWGNIIFLIAFLPMVKLLMKFGMRYTTLLCAFLMVLGTGLRCLHLAHSIRIFAYLAAVFSGIANSLTMIGPTSISCFWFPFDQRTMATGAINAIGGNLANVASFVLAKILVKDYNITQMQVMSNGSTNESDTNVLSNFRVMVGDVSNLMLVYFLFCLIIFLALVLYFPSRPKHPPSASAAVRRTNLLKGLCLILRKKAVWLLLLPYAFSLSIQSAFVSIFGIVLAPLGIGQNSADWIGLCCSFSGFFSCSLAGYFVDRFHCGLKLSLVLVVGASGLCYGWFALISFGVLSCNKAFVLAALLGGSIFCNASVPLFYELGCELAYPVGEEVTAGLLSSANNFVGVIFLLCVSFVRTDKTWISFVLSTSFLLSVPILSIIKEIRPRLTIDKTEDELS